MESNDRPSVYGIVTRVEDKLDRVEAKVDRALEKMGDRIDKLNFRYYGIIAGLIGILGLVLSGRVGA